MENETLFQPLLRSTRPVAVVEAGAAAFAVVFLVAVPATAFLAAAVVPFLAVEVAALPAAVRLTTVPVLASLVSLLALIRRAVLVAGRDGGARVGAAMRFVFVAVDVPLELELVLEAAVTFLATRVALAFSTMLESIRVAVAERDGPEFFSGEAGRAICDLTGDAGRDRFASREFEEVGDKTVGRTCALSVARAARIRFFAFSIFSKSFSLSPEIASLQRYISVLSTKVFRLTHTSCALEHVQLPSPQVQERAFVSWGSVELGYPLSRPPVEFLGLLLTLCI